MPRTRRMLQMTVPFRWIRFCRNTVLLILEEGIDTVRFSMGYSGHSVEEAILRAQNGMQACVKTVVDQNLDFYNHISRPTNDKLFARTYAKAFSVLRTNVPGI